MATPVDEPLVRWEWLASHGDELTDRAAEHLGIAGLSFVIGTAVAALLTVVIRRWRWTTAPITTVTTTLYTIPSVALFAALIPVFGVGRTVPVIALSTYSLVVLTPFLVAAFDQIDPAVIDAADAMGMTRSQRFLRVDIPVAAPAIVAGLRVTIVTIIGLVTVGGLFGLGGFGDFIDQGLTRDFPTLIVVGVTGSVALALVADALLVVIGRAAAPWTGSS